MAVNKSKWSQFFVVSKKKKPPDQSSQPEWWWWWWFYKNIALNLINMVNIQKLFIKKNKKILNISPYVVGCYRTSSDVRLRPITSNHVIIHRCPTTSFEVIGRPMASDDVGCCLQTSLEQSECLRCRQMIAEIHKFTMVYINGFIFKA